MKKLFNKIRTSAMVLCLLALPQIVNAKVNLESVFKKYRINGRTEYSELNNVANLPDPDVIDLIIEIIKIILRISGILTFLALSIGGIMYIISRGEGDGTMLENAKKTMIWSVVGVIIIMSAYAIVYGITTIKYNV
ncbi:MAG: hypothetical protein Q8P68_02040 [Candidatus Peregrinibacteria bacterium]|nr:hypothetical protein [Candidatus Peregrinibacteria bacterium]MDZ4244541.1 hypothetical protein [Candidatus Gracilibacteria bacterium]